MNSPDVMVPNIKNHQVNSGPVPSCMLTGNSPQEITKSEDACYPLHHIGKSLKVDSDYRKDFILLIAVLSFDKVLELN